MTLDQEDIAAIAAEVVRLMGARTMTLGSEDIAAIAALLSPPPPRFMSTEEVCAAIGKSDTTIWRMERAGQFPSRRQTGLGNSTAYLASEIYEWIISRPVVKLQPNKGVTASESAPRT